MMGFFKSPKIWRTVQDTIALNFESQKADGRKIKDLTNQEKAKLQMSIRENYEAI